MWVNVGKEYTPPLTATDKMLNINVLSLFLRNKGSMQV
jgi:hypothetical protein